MGSGTHKCHTPEPIKATVKVNLPEHGIVGIFTRSVWTWGRTNYPISYLRNHNPEYHTRSYVRIKGVRVAITRPPDGPTEEYGYIDDGVI